MIYILLISIGFFVFVRIQLEKYLGVDVDWHLLLHVITLAIGCLAALRIIYVGKIKYHKNEMFFLGGGIVFLIAGLFSIKNGFFITLWGIYEYLYMFLLMYFISFFFPNEKDIVIIWKSFSFLSFFIICTALYQHIEFQLNRAGIMPSLIFSSPPEEAIRMGILRPPSLVGTTSEWGMFVLLYFIAKLAIDSFKISAINFMALISILTAATRSLYICFVAVVLMMLFVMTKKNIHRSFDVVTKLFVFHNYKNTRFFLLALSLLSMFVIVVVLVYAMAGNIDYTQGEGTLRGYAFLVAEGIKNKTTGLGPGMFGSYVSFVLDSPYVKNVTAFIFADAMRIKTIDSFWLQLFIETGWFGVIMQFVIFLGLYIVMKRIWHDTSHPIIKSTAFSSMFIPIIYIFNGLGFTSFMPTFVVWSSLLAGVCLGYFRYRREGRVECD